MRRSISSSEALRAALTEKARDSRPARLWVPRSCPRCRAAGNGRSRRRGGSADSSGGVASERRERDRRRRRLRPDRDDVPEMRQLRLARQDHLGGRAVLALRKTDGRGRAAVREQRFDLGAAIRHVDRLQGRADDSRRRDSRAGIRRCSAVAPPRCRRAPSPSPRRPAASESARACRPV